MRAAARANTNSTEFTDAADIYTDSVALGRDRVTRQADEAERAADEAEHAADEAERAYRASASDQRDGDAIATGE